MAIYKVFNNPTPSRSKTSPSHKGLWALKFPTNRKGGGSWDIKSVISGEVNVSGRYREQMVIYFSRSTRTATACKEVNELLIVIWRRNNFGH